MDDQEQDPLEAHAPSQEELEELASSLTPSEKLSANELGSDESDEPQGVPEHIEELLQLNGVYVPENLPVQAREPYDRMLNGQCVACGGELKNNTVAFLTKHGISMLFCSGVCVSDYNIIGWLAQTYDDLTDALKFRGGNHG